jgi:predicted transposase YdaD
LGEFHLKEVEGMLEMDYDEEEIHELFKEEGRKEGIIKGRAEGMEEERNRSVKNMLAKGRSAEEIVDFCGYSIEFVRQVEKDMQAAVN